MVSKIFVLALIYVAVVGVAMAAEAPALSPTSSPAPSSPKESAPVATTPTVSPTPPTVSDSPASSPADDDQPIDFGAPTPGLDNDIFDDEPAAPEEDVEPSDHTNGASSLKISAVVAVVAAGFFF
ncbi:classical arabinogalactan protein 11-like [Vicia villosa]|uniref:classical arabinogalactan protein 11-like n=1 Tax=Vicia villosa TaxID=3911 RepID=UPI00273AB90D|nr:classical arabinogalactan protein 11-like [Vicia villosa]